MARRLPPSPPVMSPEHRHILALAARVEEASMALTMYALSVAPRPTQPREETALTATELSQRPERRS